MINNEDIIINNFFTKEIHQEIIEYINSYAKIFPYITLNNVSYKKNLDYIDSIHYQINSYFQNIININLSPIENYLQKYSPISNSINIFNTSDNAICYHYFINECNVSVDNINYFKIKENAGLLSLSNNKTNIKNNNDVYIISFYFYS